MFGGKRFFWPIRVRFRAFWRFPGVYKEGSGDDHDLRLSSRELAIKIAGPVRIDLKKAGMGRIFDQCDVGTLDKINLEFARTG